MNKDKQNQNDLDGSAFSRLMMRFKTYCFDFCKVLTGEDPYPLWMRIIIYIIETMQILSLGFKENLRVLFKSEVSSNVVKQILSIPTFMIYVEKMTFESYLAALYSCFSLILVFIIIVTLAKSKNKTDQRMIAPPPIVQVARFISQIFAQVLFYPLCEVFLGIIICKEGTIDGKQTIVHSYYQNTECFNSSYIVHMIFAFVGLILTIIYCATIVVLQFDCRYKSSSPISKSNGYNEFKILLFKLIILFSISIFNQQSNQTIFIIIYIFLSNLLFNSVNRKMVYMNFLIYKIVLIQVALNLWTASIMIITLLTREQFFDQGIILYVIGCVLSVIIIILKNEYRYDILLQNSNYIESVENNMEHIDYLVKLLRYYGEDKYVRILFDGFFEYHKTICNRVDCPAKRVFIKTRKLQKIFKDPIETEFMIQLLYLIDQFYQIGISRNPKNVQFRINHAMFQLDKLKQKQHALQQLFYCDQLMSSFQQEFVIQRFKKIIEIEMEEDDVSGGKVGKGQNINELAYNSYISQLKGYIEKSSSLHIDFWSHLLEDNPDLMKLCEIGNRINYVNKNIQHIWDQLSTQQLVPSILKLYSDFVLNILNDKELSDKIRVRMKNYEQQQVRSSNQTDLQSDSTPMVFVSAEEDTLGYLVNINMACASIFGFTKTELINQKVNGIMPDMHSQYHDTFLYEFLQSFESKILNKERLFPAKNKMGYIIPVQVIVRHVISVVSGGQFVAHVRIEKATKNICYVLIDSKKGIIENFSSSAISLLGLTKQLTNKSQVNIREIVPEYDNEIDGYVGKNGLMSVVRMVGSDQSQNPNLLMQIQATEQRFKLQGLQGYLLKFEMFNNSDLHKFNQVQKIIKKKHDKIDTKRYFQFKFKPSKLTFIGDIKEGEVRINSHGVVQSKGQEDEFSDRYMTEHNSQMDLSMSYNVDKSKADYRLLRKLEQKNAEQVYEKNTNVVIRRDYGIGIRMLRLYNQQLYDVEEFGDNESSEEEREQKQKLQKMNRSKEQGQEQQQDENNNIGLGDDPDDQTNIFKNRNSLSKFIENNCQSKKNQTTKKLQIFSLLILLLLFVVSSCNYLITSDSIMKTNKGYDLLKKLSKRESLIQIILGSLIQLNAMKHQYLQGNSTVYTEMFNKQIKYLDEYGTDLQKLNIDLTSKSTLFSNPKLDKLQKEQSVKIVSLEQGLRKNRYYDINEATNQMIVKIFEVKLYPQTKINLFDLSNPSFFYLYYNGLNEYKQALFAITQNIVQELNKTTNNNNVLIVFFFIASFIILGISMILILPSYKSLVYVQKEVVLIFLEISIHQVRQMFNNAEKFLNAFQIQEEENVSDQYSNDEMLNEDDDQMGGLGQKKKRKYRMQNKSQQKFFIQFLLISMILQLYFIVDYTLINQLTNKMNQIIKQANCTINIEPQMSSLNNIIRNSIIEPQIPADNIYSFNVALQSKAKLHLILTELEKQNLENRDDHGSAFINVYDNVMTSKTCQVLEQDLKKKTLQECEQFANGLIKEGLVTATTNQLANFNYMIELVDYYSSNPQLGFQHNDENRNMLLRTTNTTLNNMINVMETQRSVVSNQLQQEYFYYLYEYINDKFVQDIDESVNLNNTIRLTLFVVNIIILISVYILFWIPIFSQLQSTIQSTKNMIIMIPINIILKTNSIKKFLIAYFDLKDQV